MLPKKFWVLPLLLLILVSFAWFFYWKLLLPSYLTFSDTAKFADIARNLILGGGYGTSFTFFGAKMPEMVGGLFPAGVPPFYPFTLTAFFKIFGITDLAVILTSGILYLAGGIARGKFEIKPDQTYEREGATAILLIRK